MSNDAINWAFKTPLKTTQKFVLVALADYADEKNSCNPAHKTTAKRVGASVATVRRAIDQLEAQGYLKVVKRATEAGRQTSNRYVLNIGFMGAQFATPGAHQRAGEVLTTEQGRCSPLSSTGCSPLSNEPLKEPLTKPLIEPRESQSDLEPKGSGLTPQQEVTNWVYDKVNGSINYKKVMGVVRYHLDRGRAQRDVAKACVGLYEMGKPITNQTVGQYIDGAFARTGHQTYEQKVSSMVNAYNNMAQQQSPWELER